MSLSLTYLDHLQRQNADDLAFYPLATLGAALEDGHVVSCEDNGEPAGYLWFGALRGGYDVTIYQACVDYESRRRYLGWGMVAELTALATAAGCTGIRLKCASSADSNTFWQAAGFVCTRACPAASSVAATSTATGRTSRWASSHCRASRPPTDPSTSLPTTLGSGTVRSCPRGSPARTTRHQHEEGRMTTDPLQLPETGEDPPEPFYVDGDDISYLTPVSAYLLGVEHNDGSWRLAGLILAAAAGALIAMLLLAAKGLI